MSAESELHAAIINRLRDTASLISLLAPHPFITTSPTVPAVVEYVPQTETPESDDRFPYVVVGDTTAAEFDTDDIHGQEHTVTLHIWDKYRGGKRVREVMGAIYHELHDQPLTVNGQNTIYCYWEFSGSVPDPDVLLQHGVTRFRVVTQQG